MHLSSRKLVFIAIPSAPGGEHQGGVSKAGGPLHGGQIHVDGVEPVKMGVPKHCLRRADQQFVEIRVKMARKGSCIQSLRANGAGSR